MTGNVEDGINKENSVGKGCYAFWHQLKPVMASLLFGCVSVLMMLVNKVVLTTYRFPSYQVLGLGQMLVIILVSGLAKALGMIHFPDASIRQFKKVWPLPLFYVTNLIFGLGSTMKLNLPMFTVLRRFTLLFVTVGQIYVLEYYESMKINFTLLLIVAGAFVAALDDLTFSLVGYIYVLINNIASAGGVVYSKQKLNTDMTKFEILFYNALLSFFPALLLALVSGDITEAYHFESWSNIFFVVYFSLSCFLGFFLMYAVILVNQLTSPLTITVVGCIKNVVVTYAGMIVGGDYMFHIYNFLGINISVTASIAYSFLKLKENATESEDMKEVTEARRNNIPISDNAKVGSFVHQDVHMESSVNVYVDEKKDPN